jgi:hypothetical protein
VKKFIIISLLLLPLSAFAWESFMDKCIASWVGYPLDSVIKKWGYPNYEKSIAGKKLYVWEEFDYDVDTDRGGWSIVATDKKGRETTFSSGGVPVVEYCRKTLETDENNLIINGHWEGNDCPKFYLAGKKFVNPANNEWARK